jgi:hypothetical protein
VCFSQCLHDALAQLGAMRLRLSLCFNDSPTGASCARRLLPWTTTGCRRSASCRRKRGNVCKGCVANYLNESSDKLGRQVRELSFECCSRHRAASLSSFRNRAKSVFPAALPRPYHRVVVVEQDRAIA